MKISLGQLLTLRTLSLDYDHTGSLEMGTSTSKGNSLTLIALVNEDNVGLDMFEDVYCFKVDEEH